ncbi:TPA: hypothetical protein ACH3X1_015665 [Trebouxia sp. C0004]
MLLAYAAHKYNVPLPVEACNAFLRSCTCPSTDKKASTAAALALLHGLHAPLPAPNLKTFYAVTLCILAHLDNGMPAYQLLVQLHEQVLPKLHARCTDRSKIACTIGQSDGDAHGSARHGWTHCSGLLEAVDDYNEQWLRSTFGDTFLDEVEAVFIGDKVLASSAELAMFPALPKPALIVRKLVAQRTYLDFADGDMPDFMVPPETWSTYHMRLQSQEVQETPSEEVLGVVQSQPVLSFDKGF